MVVYSSPVLSIDFGAVKKAASVMPKLFASGVKAMAFVIPQNVITKLALSSFAREQGMPPNVRYFDNLAEAEMWLLTF